MYKKHCYYNENGSELFSMIVPSNLDAVVVIDNSIKNRLKLIYN